VSWFLQDYHYCFFGKGWGDVIINTEELTLTFQDWMDLGYKGKIEFLCPCGCKKKFILNILGFKRGGGK